MWGGLRSSDRTMWGGLSSSDTDGYQKDFLRRISVGL